MIRQRLPRTARLVLRLSVPEDSCDQVILDLEEVWARERATSRLTATLWIWREVLSFAARFLGERLREATGARIGHLELKLARRTIARTPLLTATAIASLAVGITLAAAAFGLVSNVMYGRLDVPEGENVVQLRDVDRLQGWDYFVDEPTFVRRRQAFRTIDLAAYSTASVLLEHRRTARAVSGATLTTNGFEVLREQPIAGRLFSHQDERSAGLDVCVIGGALAYELFGSPRDAIGATLRVDGRLLTVIGVMRPGFHFPFESSLWLPRAMSATGSATPVFKLYGRLRDGASRSSAAAEFAVIARRDTIAGVPAEQMTHRVLGFTELAAKPGVTWGLWLAVAALVALMLVSAANVANVLLARAATRGFEFAVRSALGASRSRIAGQLVLEALFVAIAASLLGALGARTSLEWLRGAMTDLPYWVELALNWRVLGFIAVLAVVATAVLATIPANRVLRSSLADTIKDGRSPVKFGRLSTLLIALELAIAVGFLGGTASVGQGLAEFGFAASGVDGSRTLVAQLYFGQPPRLERADAPTNAEARQREWAAFESLTIHQARLLVQRLQATPLVEAAALGSHFPGNEPTDRVIEIENDAAVHRTRVVEAGEGYLATLGSNVERGREFLTAEHVGTDRAVLVNERFAQRYNLRNALGRRLRFRSVGADQAEPWYAIVGVVPDLALNPGSVADGDGVYLPLQPTTITRIAIRARGTPATLIPLLHQEVLRLDPAPRVQWAKTLAAQMAEPVTIFRVLGGGLTALGSIALILAAAGVYALLALRVTQSRRELAVRMAIGARTWRIVQTVLARTAWPAVFGLALGATVAAGITRLIATIPFQIERREAIGLVGVLAVIAIVALLGCAIPLRTALRLRPVDLLRSD